MTTEEAIKQLCEDPQFSEVMHGAYLLGDLTERVERFEKSAEFFEVLRLIEKPMQGQIVLDIGAGCGIASYAFAKAGAAKVYALEPDPSEIIGHGAIRKIQTGLPIEILDTVGEKIGLTDESVDVVYVRQVLHHISNLSVFMAEVRRLLKVGGTLIACREHVADDEAQRAAFLSQHPVHQLAGGENAYRLEEYVGAMESAGLHVTRVIRPWDSVINAFPAVKRQSEIDTLARDRYRNKFGALGALIGQLPPIRHRLMEKLNNEKTPGRMYSFVAVKS